MESNSRNSGWLQVTDKSPELHSSKCDTNISCSVDIRSNLNSTSGVFIVR